MNLDYETWAKVLNSVDTDPKEGFSFHEIRAALGLGVVKTRQLLRDAVHSGQVAVVQGRRKDIVGRTNLAYLYVFTEKAHDTRGKSIRRKVRNVRTDRRPDA